MHLCTSCCYQQRADLDSSQPNASNTAHHSICGHLLAQLRQQQPRYLHKTRRAMCTTSGNIHLLTPSLCTPNCQLLPSTTMDQTHHPARDAFLPSSMRLPTRKESGKYYTQRTSDAACRLQHRLDAIMTHWLGSIHVQMLLGLHQSSHLHAKAANTPGTAWPPAERTTGPDKTDTHSETLHPPLTQYCSPAEQPITLTGVAGQGHAARMPLQRSSPPPAHVHSSRPLAHMHK